MHIFYVAEGKYFAGRHFYEKKKSDNLKTTKYSGH